MTRTTDQAWFLPGEETVLKNRWMGDGRAFDKGTQVRVEEFGERCLGHVNYGRAPGFYADTNALYVMTKGGDRFIVRDSELKPLRKKPVEIEYPSLFRRALPETAFYDRDWVSLDGKLFMITSVDYWMAEIKPDFAIYSVRDKEGHYLILPEDRLQLVERGPVWSHYHGIKNQFDSLDEEASFARRLGLFKTPALPTSKFYIDSPDVFDEVVGILRSGEAHGFYDALPKFEGGSSFDYRSVDLIRYDDEDLGERVRKATLKGLGVIHVQTETPDMNPKFR